MLTGKCMFKNIVGRKKKKAETDQSVDWTEKK